MTLASPKTGPFISVVSPVYNAEHILETLIERVAEQVAKVHPDKFLVVDAYSVYAAPPVERKLHPNLVVRFAPLGYHADDYRQESLRDWDGWSKAAKIR